MKFGIEALDTVKDLARQLAVVLRQMVNRIETLENQEQINYQPQIDDIKSDMTSLNSNISDLSSTQNDQKLIQIVANQITTKTTTGNADIVASDAAAATVNAWNVRYLNLSSQTPNSLDYFEFTDSNTASSRIWIYKTGKYKVNFSGSFGRTNFNQIMVEYYPPSGDTTFLQIRGRCSTSATAIGAYQTISGGFILDIPAGREGGYIRLLQWAETKSSNENWGLFYCRGSGGAPNNFTPTCSISVNFIE